MPENKEGRARNDGIFVKLLDKAQKKYDGTALYSDTFKLISGSLCSGHTLSVVGARRVAVGISENVPISYAIYQEKNGVRSDVTDCYQITFSYGTLTVKP